MLFVIICGILIIGLVCCFRGIIEMKHIRRKIKNKIFHDKRCRRLCESRNRNSASRYGKNYKQSVSKRFFVRAPKEMSLFDATGITLDFFEDVIEKIRKCSLRYTLYFDLSQVEYITPDAVMYLIAIINNTRRVRALSIHCQGNMPTNTAAKAVFEDAGFFKFVYAPNSGNIKDSTKHMKIQNGAHADNILAASFCDFVHANCQKNYIDTKRLYPMIVELMTNTHQHAYHSARERDGHLEMYSNWYIFAQDVGNAIRFVFLDTGVGIPRTVSRKIREKLSELLNTNNDVAYLQSALKGDYSRTETRLDYRGKGLPGIYEDCQNGHITNLKIISGRAKCLVNSDASITAEKTDLCFEGTLFVWDIVK